jgi:hypothetical protein
MKKIKCVLSSSKKVVKRGLNGLKKNQKKTKKGTTRWKSNKGIWNIRKSVASISFIMVIDKQ